VDVTLTALAGFEIEFEVRVVVGDFGDVGEGGFAQWCAAEVGMEDYAGGVNDGAERELRAAVKDGGDLLLEGCEFEVESFGWELSGGDAVAQAGEGDADNVQNATAAVGLNEGFNPWSEEEFVDGGQAAIEFVVSRFLGRVGFHALARLRFVVSHPLRKHREMEGGAQLCLLIQELAAFKTYLTT